MVKGLIVLIYCGLHFNLTAASICAPNSKFKIDCNSCICSSDGTRYSCTDYKCLPRKYENFYKTETKDGHELLVPNEDEFVLKKPRSVQTIPDIQDVDNSKKLDVEVMDEQDSDESDFIDSEDETGSNEIDQKRWESIEALKFPE